MEEPRSGDLAFLGECENEFVVPGLCCGIHLEYMLLVSGFWIGF